MGNGRLGWPVAPRPTAPVPLPPVPSDAVPQCPLPHPPLTSCAHFQTAVSAFKRPSEPPTSQPAPLPGVPLTSSQRFALSATNLTIVNAGAHIAGSWVQFSYNRSASAGLGPVASHESRTGQARSCCSCILNSPHPTTQRPAAAAWVPTRQRHGAAAIACDGHVHWPARHVRRHARASVSRRCGRQRRRAGCAGATGTPGPEGRRER
jgi:hypothetical protein